jgi:hypothetical protein
MLRPQPPFKYDPDAVVGGVLGILTPATYEYAVQITNNELLGSS